MSPDVGTSPDASDTGFEELMDVSDGKGISHLGLFWEIIRSGLYHLIIRLTLYTLPSVCIFSILFSISFLRC